MIRSLLMRVLDDRLPLLCKLGRHDVQEHRYRRTCRRCPTVWDIDLDDGRIIWRRRGKDNG